MRKLGALPDRGRGTGKVEVIPCGGEREQLRMTLTFQAWVTGGLDGRPLESNRETGREDCRGQDREGCFRRVEFMKVMGHPIQGVQETGVAMLEVRTKIRVG